MTWPQLHLTRERNRTHHRGRMSTASQYPGHLQDLQKGIGGGDARELGNDSLRELPKLAGMDG